MTMLTFLAACAAAPELDSAPPAPVTPIVADSPVAVQDLSASVGKPVDVDARDLVLTSGGVVVEVPYLHARLVPNGDYVDLGRPRSFSVEVQALEIRIPEQTLNSAFTGGSADASPFRSARLETQGDSLVVDGTTKALHLPFTLRAEPRITKGGDLALDLEQVRILGVGVRGFLKAFQRPIEKAVNKKQHMLNVDEDHLVIDPFPFLGPPKIKARFTSVELKGDALVARLGEGRKSSDQVAGIRLSGGVFRSDGTLFFDTTLSLVPQEGATFRIDVDRFEEQQAAGFAKISPGRVVTLFVPAPGELPAG